MSPSIPTGASPADVCAHASIGPIRSDQTTGRWSRTCIQASQPLGYRYGSALHQPVPASLVGYRAALPGSTAYRHFRRRDFILAARAAAPGYLEIIRHTCAVQQRARCIESSFTTGALALAHLQRLTAWNLLPIATSRPRQRAQTG